MIRQTTGKKHIAYLISFSFHSNCGIEILEYMEIAIAKLLSITAPPYELALVSSTDFMCSASSFSFTAVLSMMALTSSSISVPSL